MTERSSVAFFLAGRKQNKNSLEFWDCLKKIFLAVSRVCCYNKQYKQYLQKNTHD